MPEVRAELFVFEEAHVNAFKRFIVDGIVAPVCFEQLLIDHIDVSVAWLQCLFVEGAHGVMLHIVLVYQRTDVLLVKCLAFFWLRQRHKSLTARIVHRLELEDGSDLFEVLLIIGGHLGRHGFTAAEFLYDFFTCLDLG